MPNWPFKRRKSKADEAIEVLPALIENAAGKWRDFYQTFQFKDGVGLDKKIWLFTTPFSEGVREHVPAMKDAPDGLILLIVAKGVEQSGTHTRAEIEEALGMPLPE
jgi:hypothetical protein